MRYSTAEQATAALEAIVGDTVGITLGRKYPQVRLADGRRRVRGAAGALRESLRGIEWPSGRQVPRLEGHHS